MRPPIEPVKEQLHGVSRGLDRLHSEMGESALAFDAADGEMPDDIEDGGVKQSADSKRAPLWLFVRR